MLVVTTNYRLGALGFLGSDAVRALDPSRRTTGNAGILDQRAALKWVHRHIRAFGGDPRRVLLAGESAGGASVINHLVRPASWGLFAAAAQQSGAYTLLLGQPGEIKSEVTYRAVLNATRCADVRCLQSLSADDLLSSVALLWELFEPCVDGADLSAPVAELLRAKRVAPGVPVITGATAQDLRFLPGPRCPSGATACSRSDFRAWARIIRDTIYPKLDVDELERLYETTEPPAGGDYSRWYWAQAIASSDQSMICTARLVARRLEAAGCATASDPSPLNGVCAPAAPSTSSFAGRGRSSTSSATRRSARPARTRTSRTTPLRFHSPSTWHTRPGPTRTCGRSTARRRRIFRRRWSRTGARTPRMASPARAVASRHTGRSGVRDPTSARWNTPMRRACAPG